MDKKMCAQALIVRFPAKQALLDQHMADYGELLPHVFFAQAINEPLIRLLRENGRRSTIRLYCDFIEEMRLSGDDEVKNVVDVTILERLADDPAVWKRFGAYLSEPFRYSINHEVLVQNPLMRQAEPL